MRKRTAPIFLLLLMVAGPFAAAGDSSDRRALDELQRAAFRYAWEYVDPHSGMVYEASYDWETRPVAVGGTGFAVAAIVVAADREWITRSQAVRRITKIARFLLEKTPRNQLHGAFPHWIDGVTGQAMRFGHNDQGADIVETSLLLQGLLIARAYFNGPGVERELRELITELWEGVDWNWFTNGEESGLYWHWDSEKGFSYGLKILGYNECLITYVLAMSSPTHPISRDAYNYWTQGADYLPRDVYGYRVEAAPDGGGPLFLAHYSFIGLDPRRMADALTPSGYFLRGVKQTLSNRGYCLQEAPPENQYAENFWGLTASQILDGYAANYPLRDNATVAPTAAISSMPYTPHYSMRVLQNFRGGLRKRVWGPYGPFDAISLRHNWVSDLYLAIDQLPMVCMVENYRSGLLWRLLMSDPEIRNGLGRAGIAEPAFATGLPEAVPTLRKENGSYLVDAYEIRRHPDSGLYSIPYWCAGAGENVVFEIIDDDDEVLFTREAVAATGRNYLIFPGFTAPDDETLFLIMRVGTEEWRLPLRLH